MAESRKRLAALQAALIAVFSVAVATPAGAQLLGRGLGGPLTLPAAPLPDVRETLDRATAPLEPQSLLATRGARLRALVRAHPRDLELDPAGDLIVRGAILAVAPAPEALARAEADGFAAHGPAVDSLDLQIVRLQAPEGMSAADALARLRKLDPRGAYDFDPIYGPSGLQDAAPAGAPTASAGRQRADVRIGLVDTGADVAHPALARARIEQKGFASPEAVPAAHGTAVASLIVGEDGRFEGVAPGATLMVADVYGRSPTGGSGDLLVRALAWTAARGARVVNMSLVGPPNLALGAAVRALQVRGILIVAPVGNDGPAAPPAYPASYPGVVAVTGVDRRGRVLIEAGHASHLDFAAPGAEVTAASLSGGFAPERGTSFAAPVVAGRLALAEAGGARTPAAAIAALAAASRHGPGYGKGLVTAQVETVRGR